MKSWPEDNHPDELDVFYWPQMDIILVSGFDDLPEIFEAPNVTNHEARAFGVHWLWTEIPKKYHKEFVKLGKL